MRKPKKTKFVVRAAFAKYGLYLTAVGTLATAVWQAKDFGSMRTATKEAKKLDDALRLVPIRQRRVRHYSAHRCDLKPVWFIRL